jgi:hypothetical protein
VTPASFLREVDERARGDHYRPVDLSGTTVTRREVGGSDLAILANTFVNHQNGERIGELRRKVELAAAHPALSHLELVEVNREPRGLLGWEANGELSVTLLRVTAGRGATTIGRHLLGLVRSHAVAAGKETIRVLDPSPSAFAQDSFRDGHVLSSGVRG